jgi:DMSO/TMAO reductase YedYZ molybdopterin-dependent catalytic subunit
MITREKEPPNLEMPFSALDGFVTPNERFYVRCHFPIPKINEGDWRLKVEGKVARPFEVTMDDLRQMPAHRITATLECAGNSRVFLVPKVKGVQWELGAVGNAEWTGISLRELLQRAEIANEAREIILEGADNGTIAEPPRPAGKINFARSIPLEKAMDDVLLAFAMNGEPLSAAHGFPLRAVVPGWYGMASIKWLQRIIATDQSFNGYYQSIDYAFWRRGDGGPALIPLTEMQVKAEIAHPENNELIRANENYLVKGAAWTADAEVAKVEVTFDGGKSWDEAALRGDSIENAWRLWEFEWQTPAPGNYILMARAADSRGRIQPLERDANGGTYMINHCLPIEVEVRL